jgi:hypothetical protein
MHAILSRLTTPGYPQLSIAGNSLRSVRTGADKASHAHAFCLLALLPRLHWVLFFPSLVFLVRLNSCIETPIGLLHVQCCNVISERGRDTCQLVSPTFHFCAGVRLKKKATSTYSATLQAIIQRRTLFFLISSSSLSSGRGLREIPPL